MSNERTVTGVAVTYGPRGKKPFRRRGVRGGAFGDLSDADVIGIIFPSYFCEFGP